MTYWLKSAVEPLFYAPFFFMNIFVLFTRIKIFAQAPRREKSVHKLKSILPFQTTESKQKQR